MKRDTHRTGFRLLVAAALVAWTSPNMVLANPRTNAAGALPAEGETRAQPDSGRPVGNGDSDTASGGDQRADELGKATTTPRSIILKRRSKKVQVVALALNNACSSTLKARLGTDICNLICEELEVCAMQDLEVAAAAVLADYKNLNKLLVQLKTRVEKARLTAESGDRSADPTALNQAVSDIKDITQSGYIAAGEALGNQLNVILSGLAKFLLDRAKREAVSWLVDRLVNDLCAPTKKNIQYMPEIRHYWLPSLCTFVTSTQDTGYGTGSILLDTLVGAIRSDMQRLPGTMAGLTMGYLFKREARPDLKPVDNWFLCKPEECPAVDRVRQASTTAISDILGGVNPWDRLYAAAETISADNVEVEKPKRIKSVVTAALGCGLSLPSLLNQDLPDLHWLQSDRARLGVAISGSLGQATSCWHLLGLGVDTKKCKVFSSGAKTAANSCTAVSGVTSDNVERFSTAARLVKNSLVSTHRIAAQWKTVAAAFAAFQSAVESQPTVQELITVATANTKSGVEALARIKAAAASARIVAGLHLVEESISFALVLSDTMFNMSNAAEMIPAVKSAASPGGTAKSRPHDLEKVKKNLTAIRGQIPRIKAVLRAARLAAGNQWGQAALELSRVAETLVAAASGNKTTSKKFFQQLSRYSGLIAAVFRAQDSDEVAQAFEQATDPIGGWRNKFTRKSWTLSLTAHVGFGGGAEWRNGQYGVFQEDMGMTYGQAPTLMMPLGLDFAWGFETCVVGFFLPLIDPAAFLQYDLSKDGRLPGARPLTVLSPGFGLRWSPWKAPFSILPMVLYRPKLRTWDSTVDGPGADAVQLLMIVAVDVTLFRLYQGRRD